MAYTTLIAPQQLNAALGRAGWIVFDCRFDLTDPPLGRRAYAEGHVPGAHYAHLDEDLSAPSGPGTGRHPLPDPAGLAAWLGARGVTGASQVVVYDDLGGAVASRLWWLLRWLGHDAVALLDGGIDAWRDAGHALQTTPAAAPGGPPYPFTCRDEAWLDTPALVAALERGEVRLLDARTAPRFRGEQEPIDPVAGHVPGAVNHYFGDDLDATRRFRPATELREHLSRSLGGAAPHAAVCMCGSGVTACHTLLAMEIAGLHGARLYPGSWSEWITDRRRPVATGA